MVKLLHCEYESPVHRSKLKFIETWGAYKSYCDFRQDLQLLMGKYHHRTGRVQVDYDGSGR